MSTETQTITETDLFDAEKEAYYRGELDYYLYAPDDFDPASYVDEWPTESEIAYWDAQYENGLGF